MTRLAPVFGPLDKAADAVIETSRSDLRVKRDVLDTLADGIGFLANAVGVMAWDAEEATKGTWSRCWSPRRAGPG